MKIDKTTYKGRKERLNVMTAGNTSRPEKALFFADLENPVILTT